MVLYEGCRNILADLRRYEDAGHDQPGGTFMQGTEASERRNTLAIAGAVIVGLLPTW